MWIILKRYFTGFTGGGYYNDLGGAVNYLCLPPDPIWGKSYTSNNWALLYGAEYDTAGPFFGMTDPDDVPCTVCRSRSSKTMMMLPARDQCYNGWHKQFSGYLSTAYSGHKSQKEYICVDQSPEALQAGGHNDEGALFYPVQTKCGSLACPPYKDGLYVTCVVCTKWSQLNRVELELACFLLILNTEYGTEDTIFGVLDSILRCECVLRTI